MPAEVRRRAKAINFGIIYGISAFGLANQLGIPREEAGAYIKSYFERFPGIRDYMDAMRRKVRADGYVSTLFGRKIHFPQAKNPAERAFVERASINAPIQGTAADIIRRAMIRMEPALAEAGLSARMLLQVHDELIFEAPEEEVEATMPVIARVMAAPPSRRCSSRVPLQVDAKAGDNWDAAHFRARESGARAAAHRVGTASVSPLPNLRALRVAVGDPIGRTCLVDAPRPWAGEDQVEEHEAEEHRRFAFVQDREEAVRQVRREVGDRHFAGHDESGRAGVKADKDEKAANDLDQPGDTEEREGRRRRHAKRREIEIFPGSVGDEQKGGSDAEHRQKIRGIGVEPIGHGGSSLLVQR